MVTSWSLLGRFRAQSDGQFIVTSRSPISTREYNVNPDSTIVPFEFAENSQKRIFSEVFFENSTCILEEYIQYQKTPTRILTEFISEFVKHSSKIRTVL